MKAGDFSVGLKRIVMLDGATGTELAKRGMPAGVCPELWALEHPEAVNELHGLYENVGSDIVYVPSFCGNRIKFGEFGLADRVSEINRRLAEISRNGVSKALVFGDISSTGCFVEPFGELEFETAVSVYREQASALLDGGVDGFAIETMMDLQEARAALIAVRELDAGIPVFVTMTFDVDGRTLMGNTPESAMVGLQALGATAVGCNCSAGPRQMSVIVSAMRRVARIPVIAKPNAGMPRLDSSGRTVFEMGAEEFGEAASQLVGAGASIVGGCCGTTPEHIESLAKRVSSMAVPSVGGEGLSFVSSASSVVEIGACQPFRVIGERLNPTGKKQLQEELRSGRTDMVRRFAKEQAACGADLLDVNCGASGVDEASALRRTAALLAAESSLPLCIDTTSPEAAEAALRIYPGRAMFNSISAEKVRLEKVLPVAAKYGAHIIALPLGEGGVPGDVAEYAENLRRIEEAACALGLRHCDISADALVMTVSANQDSAARALDCMEWVARSWKGSSVCGLSNVSFGLPRRDLVNRTFLGAAIGRGLSMAIANPMKADIMETARASDVLMGRDDGATAFIARFGGAPATAAKPSTQASEDNAGRAFDALVEGNADELERRIEELLKSGKGADEIVREVLVPAIAEVGDRYEKKSFFLPQLMRGAMAMEQAMKALEPRLAVKRTGGAIGRIVMATVKGDIHDIGKNIVIMMLRNYGFEVTDLGKDVPAEVILDRAVEEKACIVGLSALMTTTMGEMRNVIEMARARGLDGIKFIVGGAVVDEEFASSIGAYYAEDAMVTVILAMDLCRKGKGTMN